MKRILSVLCMTLLAYTFADAQPVRTSATYNYPLDDAVLRGLNSIRGVGFDTDVDGDGKSEIVATNYLDNGHVHIFEAVGNDSMRLVWSSPTVTAGGGGSTPRYAIFGDLDNDGKKEVIYQSQNNGIFIFEWDGVVGSDNYGTLPSQTIGTPFITLTSGNAEYFEVADVDGDSQKELLVAYNAGGTAEDNYYIVSAVGDWNTNDPGFSSFTVEYTGRRADLAKWGIGGGSPYAMIAANFDGAGNKEILIHNWNRKNVVPMRVPAANTYLLSDTTNDFQNIYLGGVDDDVALFGGFAWDIDNDGREEVYLPTYTAVAGGPHSGWIHMISYNSGQSTSIIDTTNITVLDVSPVIGGIRVFGYGYGDIDNNGKKEIYVSTSYPFNVAAVEFQGGDKRNPANWLSRLVYAGEPTIYTTRTFRDSLGNRDTSGTTQTAFVSKMWAKNTDFDGDGLQDMILPYQAINDSVTIRNVTWNAGGGTWDTITTVIPNPKRWGLRTVERSTAVGVEAKDITIITPDDYRLDQNYPNPFNPSTTIPFYLPIKDRISLRVFDVLGREVRTLINNEEYAAGVGNVIWDGTNATGQQVVSGVYFYTLRFGNFEKTNKMMLVK